MINKDQQPPNKKRSPNKIFWVAAAMAAVGIMSARSASRSARRRQRMQDAALKREVDAYRKMDMKNPYLGMRNKFAGLENTMEDLTINLKEAQFAKKQQMQQQADILKQMQSTAGGAGVAGLAQVLANQGALGAQQSAAYIGQQEAANQKLAVQEASRLQQQEAEGATRIGELQRQGAAMVEEFRQRQQENIMNIMAGAAKDASSQAHAARMAQTDAWFSGSSAAAKAGI